MLSWWGRKPGLRLRRFKEGPLSGAAEPRAPRGQAGRPGLGAAPLWASGPQAHREGTPDTHVLAVTQLSLGSRDEGVLSGCGLCSAALGVEGKSPNDVAPRYP